MIPYKILIWGNEENNWKFSIDRNFSSHWKKTFLLIGQNSNQDHNFQEGFKYCLHIALVYCPTSEKQILFAVVITIWMLPIYTGIYILQKIRNYANFKIQNGKTLPKLNIGINYKFGQYYRYDITMYDFIHIIHLLTLIWSLIFKMMLENETFLTFLLKCQSFSSHWKSLLHSLAKTLSRFRKK